MVYQTKDVVNISKVFHIVETCSKEFLLYSAWGMKYKDKIAMKGKELLGAIKEYKKIPLEIRNLFEKDKNNHVSNIIELEKAVKKAIE
jgi:hypothetical protein